MCSRCETRFRAFFRRAEPWTTPALGAEGNRVARARARVSRETNWHISPSWLRIERFGAHSRQLSAYCRIGGIRIKLLEFRSCKRPNARPEWVKRAPAPTKKAGSERPQRW